MTRTRLAGAIALLLATCPAWAADTGQLPCRSTEDCAQQAAHIGATVASATTATTTSATDRQQDQFYWLENINKASAVMLVEEHILKPDVGQRIARGIQHSLDQAAQPGGRRPSDVLQIEALITADVGPEASLVHTGRSRQDMYATFRMAKLRTQVLDFADALDGLRQRLLDLAGRNVDTIVPAYTNGVQAQPTSYAHYLLAYAASFGRDAQRIHELYARMNRSAMGTAVLANSIWPLNRPRMAQLLGFDGIVENSMDASQVIPSDVALEATAIASSHAIRVGMMLQDIHTQYHQVRPWLLLDEAATYTSSAMPQKRNPGLIMRARESASNVVGLAQAVTLRDHNITTGMTDYKDPAESLGLFAQAVRMETGFDAVLDALKVNPQRALEELEADWTTSMELAEVLQRDHGVPFRVGHGFASALVTYARAHGLRPADFPYAQAQASYGEALARAGLPVTPLPLTEARFREVLSPVLMVRTRVGTGGPQPAEVRRMLGEARASLAADQAWMQATRQRLADAQQGLDTAFARLVGH